MGSIKVLDKLTANMIAAGEVVERASSVVKELFENSLDAGATRITIEIKEGGKEFIKITDNGCGMDKEDAELCFVRYATSKLSDPTGLFSIKTMGFRGEALASICSVSKVTVETLKKDADTGIKIRCEGGEIVESGETGCPQGTSITVEDLFYNTPARLKFMKKASTEAAYIEELAGKFILANPHISIRFIKDGKEIFYSKGDGDLKSAIYSVYGRAVAENILFVDYEKDNVKIEGCIGNPNIAKPTAKFENFCVNGRICRTKTLVSALENGYFQKIAQGKHPFCSLNIIVDYEFCDVNIHPRKAEVKFSDEGLIYRVLSEAVSSTLNGNLYIRQTEEIKPEKPQYKAEIPKASFESLFTYNKPSVPKTEITYKTPFREAGDTLILREPEEKEEIKPLTQELQQVAEIIEIPVTKEKEVEPDIPNYTVAGQIFKTYIIVETEDEMLLLDQHAAHERMNYEMLRENSKKGTASQLLLVPKIIKLSPSDYRLTLSEVKTFEQLGFEIDDFSDNSIIIRAIPSNVREKALENLIYEIINEISKTGNIRNEDFNQRLLYTVACKMSIKANMELSDKEASELVKNAFLLKGNTTCPHGRPLFISFTKSFIEGKFER